MSKKETPPTEWKTIRISATSYYKLVELSGFLTILFGSQTVPISTVADWAVILFYDWSYNKLKERITDPDKLEATRKQISGSLKRWFEAFSKSKLE